MDEFNLCLVCQEKHDKLSDEMYLELKHRGSDDEDRESVQASYLSDLNDVEKFCILNHLKS